MANYSLCITVSRGIGSPAFLIKSQGDVPTTPITINSIFADGYSVNFPSCSSSISTAQNSSGTSFTPSTIIYSLPSTTSTGLWKFANYVTISNLTINGTSIPTSGTVLVNGSDTLTIYFSSCQNINTFPCPALPEPSQTPTTTNTQTPTITKTPSSTPIICGIGITTGSYFYVDCCGIERSGYSVGETVYLNYGYQFTTGINKTNVSYATSCPTPSQTQTPTITPSVTQTSTVTPTPSKTNSATPTITPTPSNTPVYKLKNDCDTFTLFDLGISCNVIKQPSSGNADGILSLNITGGTSPYQILWNGILGQQTMTNFAAGLYNATVIDYYGDYTANTVCSLFAPSSTPTQTPTNTPSQTSIPSYPSICLIAIGTQSYGPIQFTYSGILNGKPYWSSGSTYNIVWKTNRWEVVGSDLTTPYPFNGGGIFVSTTTSIPPLAGWVVNGGTQQYNISVTQGNCPSTLPLITTVTKTDATCNRGSNCNGVITILAQNGTKPYQYSIDNGNTWVLGNIFQGLCPNTYTVITRDSANSQVSNVVTINSEESAKTYQVSIALLPESNQTFNEDNYVQSLRFAKVSVTPALPVGVSLDVIINLTSLETVNGPGFGTITSTNVVTKNNVALSPYTSSVGTVTQTRPNCSPETQELTTVSTSYQFNMTGSDSIIISSNAILSILDGAIASQTNCVTQLLNTVNASIKQATINGCNCCSSSPDGNNILVNNTNVSYVEDEGSDSTCTKITVSLSQGAGGCNTFTYATFNLSPSPYNDDVITVDFMDVTLYSEFNCAGVQSNFNIPMSLVIPRGTGVKQQCYPILWGSTQAYKINNIVIGGTTYTNGQTFNIGGNCYTLSFRGCGTGAIITP
jgi:hypothetical protein